MHQNGLIFDAVAFRRVVDFLEINYFCDEKLWHSITNGKAKLELLLLIARSLVLAGINFDALMQNGVNQHSWIWDVLSTCSCQRVVRFGSNFGSPPP